MVAAATTPAVVGSRGGPAAVSPTPAERRPEDGRVRNMYTSGPQSPLPPICPGRRVGQELSLWHSHRQYSC